MVYLSDSSQKLCVHDHPSDQNCHWVVVLKPLAFLVFHVPILVQSLFQHSKGGGEQLGVPGDVEYTWWLCKCDERGILNLLNVLLHVCELPGMPNPRV
jgi:hypothetical protein